MALDNKKIDEDEIITCSTCEGDGTLFCLRGVYGCGHCGGKGRGTREELAYWRYRMDVFNETGEILPRYEKGMKIDESKLNMQKDS
jgi:DnaJ-class molecular chaperone